VLLEPVHLLNGVVNKTMKSKIHGIISSRPNAMVQKKPRYQSNQEKTSQLLFRAKLLLRDEERSQNACVWAISSQRNDVVKSPNQESESKNSLENQNARASSRHYAMSMQC